MAWTCGFGTKAHRHAHQHRARHSTARMPARLRTGSSPGDVEDYRAAFRGSSSEACRRPAMKRTAALLLGSVAMEEHATAGVDLQRLSRSRMSASISAISRFCAAMISSASFRTRGSRICARELVRMAMEW